MSTPFRNRIDAARDAYGSLKYPGDLAGEMLTTSPTTQSRWILGTLGAAAVAGMVTVLVLILPGDKPNLPTDSTEVAVGSDVLPQDTEVVQLTLSELPGMEPPRGEGLSDFSPEAPMFGFGGTPDFSFSAPSFTLIKSSDEESNTENSTTGAVYVPSNHT